MKFKKGDVVRIITNFELEDTPYKKEDIVKIEEVTSYGSIILGDDEAVFYEDEIEPVTYQELLNYRYNNETNN